MSTLVLFLGCCIGGVLFSKTAEMMGQLCGGGATDGQSSVSPDADENIPKRMLDIYQLMGRRYGLDWSILAGIGYVETRHWRNHATSSAGAMGPMQFMPATWRQYGQDGDGDGDRDIMDPVDAVAGAAHYLRASGAPQHWEKAIWAYNHSHAYYLQVMSMARKYGLGNVAGDLGRAAGNAVFNSEDELVDISSGDATGACPDDGGLSGPLAAKIVQLARRQLSIPERNREHGGYNCNFYSAARGAGGRCSNGYRSEAWCADFVIWVYKTAGASTTGANGLAKSFKDYGLLHRTWHSSNPLPGDAIVFSFGHVGIVTAVSATDVTYVSGNTSDPHGLVDVVAEKTRSKSWGAIMGYASPVPARNPQQDT